MQVNFKNFSMDMFNRDVNNSADGGDKFARWERYRAELTDFVLEAFKDTDGKNLVVFGAGHLNDLDIDRLSKRFDEVVLSDIDAKGVAKSLGKYTGLANVTINQADYTHAEECNLFGGLQKLAKRAAPPGDIISHINESFDRMWNASMSVAERDKYSAAVSCPVYTQLIYTQMEVYLKILYEYGLYEMGELNKILNAVYVRMPEVISSYNDMVLDYVSSGGECVMISDIIEMTKGGRVHKKAAELAAGKQNSVMLLEKLIKKEGIELAEIGLGDFESKAREIDKKYIIWPFDDTKEYLVCAINGKSFQIT